MNLMKIRGTACLFIERHCFPYDIINESAGGRYCFRRYLHANGTKIRLFRRGTKFPRNRSQWRGFINAFHLFIKLFIFVRVATPPRRCKAAAANTFSFVQ